MLLDVIGVVVDLCGVAGELLVAVRRHTRIGGYSALGNRSDGQRRESVLGCRNTSYFACHSDYLFRFIAF